MKILVILTSDGTIHSLRPEIEQFIELHRMGVHIEVMTEMTSAYSNILREIGIPIVGGYPKSKKDSVAIQKIHQLLSDKNYDIVHALERKGIACVLQAIKGLETKLVVYRGASGVYWHDPTAYQNVLNPRIDKVICVCNDIRNNLQKQLFFPKDKAVTVYKGHRLQWYDNVEALSRSDLGIAEDAFIVLCSAKKRKWKGVPTFLDAVDLLPQDSCIHILLVGDGMQTSFYQKKLQANRNKYKIHILGYRDDALEIAKMADVIMQTSYKNEGLSRSTIEGMALGCVPIVTDAGGNAELVIDKQSGLVVPIKNAQAMTNAIMSLYDSPNLMLKLARNAKHRIGTEFTVSKTAEETLAIYHKLR